MIFITTGGCRRVSQASTGAFKNVLGREVLAIPSKGWMRVPILQVTP